jgi:hypothetical protein
MTDKPYAWINAADEYKIIFDENFPNSYPNAWIPLYIHPANTLTDEEIDELISDVAEKPTDEDLYDFAKAILRKVKEK